MSGSTARAEWAAHWRLPLAALLGYGVSGLHVYGIGPFIEPIHQAFGWNRAQILSGVALVSVGVALGSVPLGLLIDRFGPRIIGLFGVPLACASFALLGAATGSLPNWILLWAVYTVCAIGVQSTIWVAAVVTRFEAGRGLAIAITLCGTSVAVVALPPLATWLIEISNWRYAFVGIGGLSVVVVLPLIYLFFRGARDGGRTTLAEAQAAASLLPGFTLAQAIRKPDFYKLLVASGFFSLGIIGSVVNFVPILTGAGAEKMTAAGAASMMGVFSMVGRLCMGAILDRFSASIVGAVTFLIPIPACLLLLSSHVGNTGYFAAAAMFGLTLGAEMNVITYLVARRFGLKNYGAIQGALLCAIAVGGALGPVAGGAVYDRFGGYSPALIAVAILMALSAATVVTVDSRAGQFPATPGPT